MRAGALVAVVALLAGPGSTCLAAQEPSSGGPRVVFRYSFKGCGLISRLPDAPLLFPQRNTATTFWRARVEPTIPLRDGASIDLAFEQRVRVFSAAGSGVGGGVLPADVEAPFRIRQLDWRLSSAAHAEWGTEVDRAALHLRIGAAHVTLGRQAIGWGRGVAFSAVDLFAPFTPLEADREWRRGVDGVRADVAITDRLSVDGVGAFGRDMDHSIVAGRIRGYAGRADVELLAGRRARDTFGGVSMSAAVGDIEIHGELAAFNTPGDTVVKGLAGSSYRVPIGNGLLVYGEYHYSGFGARSAAAIVARLAEPAFRERYLRGDTQILGRHAVALLGSYDYGPTLAVAGQWLVSPADASGVLIPSATVTYSDGVSMVVSGYVPHGRAPSGATLRSEFGAAPLALFIQLRVYR